MINKKENLFWLIWRNKYLVNTVWSKIQNEKYIKPNYHPKCYNEIHSLSWMTENHYIKLLKTKVMRKEHISFNAIRDLPLLFDAIDHNDKEFYTSFVKNYSEQFKYYSDSHPDILFKNAPLSFLEAVLNDETIILDYLYVKTLVIAKRTDALLLSKSIRPNLFEDIHQITDNYSEYILNFNAMLLYLRDTMHFDFKVLEQLIPQSSMGIEVGMDMEMVDLVIQHGFFNGIVDHVLNDNRDYNKVTVGQLLHNCRQMHKVDYWYNETPKFTDIDFKLNGIDQYYDQPLFEIGSDNSVVYRLFKMYVVLANPLVNNGRIALLDLALKFDDLNIPNEMIEAKFDNEFPYQLFLKYMNIKHLEILATHFQSEKTLCIDKYYLQFPPSNQLPPTELERLQFFNRFIESIDIYNYKIGQQLVRHLYIATVIQGDQVLIAGFDNLAFSRPIEDITPIEKLSKDPDQAIGILVKHNMLNKKMVLDQPIKSLHIAKLLVEKYQCTIKHSHFFASLDSNLSVLYYYKATYQKSTYYITPTIARLERDSNHIPLLAKSNYDIYCNFKLDFDKYLIYKSNNNNNSDNNELISLPSKKILSQIIYYIGCFGSTSLIRSVMQCYLKPNLGDDSELVDILFNLVSTALCNNHNYIIDMIESEFPEVMPLLLDSYWNDLNYYLEKIYECDNDKILQHIWEKYDIPLNEMVVCQSKTFLILAMKISLPLDSKSYSYKYLQESSYFKDLPIFNKYKTN